MTSEKKPGKPEGAGNPNAITVTVSYGINKTLEINRKQAVNAVLQAVLKLFDVHADPSGFRLLLQPSGAELQLNSSVEDAGVVQGSTIVLAPRAASGGR